jgi:hypothetical protein
MKAATLAILAAAFFTGCTNRPDPQRLHLELAVCEVYTYGELADALFATDKALSAATPMPATIRSAEDSLAFRHPLFARMILNFHSFFDTARMSRPEILAYCRTADTSEVARMLQTSIVMPLGLRCGFTPTVDDKCTVTALRPTAASDTLGPSDLERAEIRKYPRRSSDDAPDDAIEAFNYTLHLRLTDKAIARLPLFRASGARTAMRLTIEGRSFYAPFKPADANEDLVFDLGHDLNWLKHMLVHNRALGDD